MTDKFIKHVDDATGTYEWRVERTCSATGQREMRVGDIITINRRSLKITEIISGTSGPQAYGAKTVARFANN